FDDYEDNNISEYSGNTSLFQTSASLVYGGSYGLKAANTSGRTNTTLYRTDQTTAQGQIIRYMQYIDTTAGSGDEACTLFGVQGAGTNYAVCLEQFGTDRISVAKDVVDNDTSGSLMLGSTTVTYATGWYEVEIDWQSGGDMDVSLYTAAGSLVATVSASNNSYTSGGIGYAFWFQSGGWDSYTARPRAMTKPTVY
ncbi:hypothetical protein KC902_04930, partial [Candidatus Kaiserbacteria bacterium]|nr:hypothetical protein [Candidatus Kaiserbacteria bacterium]